jgi:hypothetical protein
MIIFISPDATNSSMFHTHILLWNCIPLLLPYIQLLLKFSKPQDEYNVNVGNKEKETTLHAFSLNFVISISKLPERYCVTQTFLLHNYHRVMNVVLLKF